MIQDRKATAQIQFLDKDGMPLKNKKVSINQTNHDFLFGWGAFDFVSYTNAKTPEDKAFYENRVTKWMEIFNYGTLPFYWGQFEPEEGKPNTKDLMNAVDFMTAHNIKAKGHPLCWHTACAQWLLNYDNETMFKKQIERIHRDVSDFKGKIDMWDAINEVVIMPVFDRYDNPVTRMCQDKGRIGLIKEVFLAAKEVNPNCKLLINDFNTSQAYEILIEGCLAAGVPIDAIGIQSHQHQGYWGLQKLEEVLKRYEHFGLPIHFTENTLVSGPLVPPEITDLNDFHYDDGCSTPENEERQKNEIEEWYRTVFTEHPLVQAITGWDFTDGMWLNAPSGLLHKDGSIKPAYTMLKNLIKNEWWTKLEVTTNDKGFAEVTGFKGEYEASFDNKKADFVIKGTESIVTKLS